MPAAVANEHEKKNEKWHKKMYNEITMVMCNNVCECKKHSGELKLHPIKIKLHPNCDNRTRSLIRVHKRVDDDELQKVDNFMASSDVS